MPRTRGGSDPVRLLRVPAVLLGPPAIVVGVAVAFHPDVLGTATAAPAYVVFLYWIFIVSWTVMAARRSSRGPLRLRTRLMLGTAGLAAMYILFGFGGLGLGSGLLVVAALPRADWIAPRCRVASAAAWMALAMACCVGLWLGLGPAYHSVSATASVSPAGGVPVAPVAPAVSDSGGDPATSTLTLVDVNGLGVIWLLVVPVLLAVLAVLTVDATTPGGLLRTMLLWVFAVSLSVLSLLASLSIGMLYLPASLALLGAAANASAGRRPVRATADGVPPSGRRGKASRAGGVTSRGRTRS